MAGYVVSSLRRTDVVARSFALPMAALFVALLIVGIASSPAHGLVTPMIIESRLAGGAQGTYFTMNGPAPTTAKSSAMPLGNWTGGWLTGTGGYYASQAFNAKWGDWAFTPAANRGGYYDVYLTWPTNGYTGGGMLLPSVIVQSADPDVITQVDQAVGGNAWNLVAECLKYDEGVAKSVQLITNPDAIANKRTYFDSVAFAPCLPTAPTPTSPADEEIDVPGAGAANDLTWTAGTANYRFDVYLSANETDVIDKAPGALVSSDLDALTFDPDGAGMLAGTTYYWKVVAKNIGEIAEGPVWSFTLGTFIASANPASWTNQNTVAISFDASNIMPIIDHYEVALDGGAYGTQTSPYDLDVTSEADGTHTVHIKAVSDMADEVFKDVTIYLDKTAPLAFVPTANPAGYTNASTVEITFGTTDAMSGIDHYEVALDGGAYSTQTSPYSLDVSGVADGTHTVHVRAFDVAGNTRDEDVLIYIDKTDPLTFTPVADPASWTDAATVQITWTTTDETSGVDHYLVGVDGADFAAQVSPYDLSTAGLADGTHTVSVVAVDAAGNERTEDVSIYIDKDPPQIVSCTSPAVFGGAAIPVDVSASDTGSGVKLIHLWYKKGSGGLWTNAGVSTASATDSLLFAGTTGDDTYYFGLVVEDNVGNITSNNTDDGLCQTVYDHVAPNFSNIDAAPQYAKEGTEVLISFTASEELDDDPVVTVNGNSATIDEAVGQDYVYSYTIQSGDAEGFADIYIQGTDLAGNSSFTDDMSQLLIDKSAPVDFTPAADPASWTNADSVSISFATTDDLSGIHHYEVALNAGAYSTQTSPYSLDVSGLPDGTHTVHVKAIDNAGNELVKDVSVYLDTAGPVTFTPTADPASWTSANSVSIAFATTDAGAGISHYEVALDGGAYTTQTSPYALDVSAVADGTHTVHVKAIDNVGNELIRDVSIYLDKTEPVTFTPSANPASWTNANSVSISFATTDADSGIAHYEVALDGGAYATQTSPYSLDVSAVADGTHTVHVKAIDNAGNERINDVSIYVDKADPLDFTPAADPASWTNANSVSISFATTDDVSGVHHYEVALNAGAYSTQTSPYSLDVSGLPDGTHTVHVKAIDNAGNELVKDVSVYRDTAGPVTFTPTADPASWTNANSVSISFSTTDAGAGMSHYEIALDGGAYTTQTSPYALDVSAVADGTHTVHVKAIDNLGNELVRDVSIYLDKTGPLAFTPSSVPTVWYSWPGAGTVQITWATSDAASGVDHYEVALGAGPYTARTSPYTFDPEGLPSGTYTMHIRAFDAAGNYTTCDLVAEASDDAIPPTASLTFTDPNPGLGRDFDYVFWKNWMGVNSSLQNTYNINWTAADAHSGLAAVYVECRANPDDPWTLLTTSTEGSGTVAFDVSSLPESDSYQFRVRATDENDNQTAVVYDQFGVYDATKLVPTAKIISPANGAYLKMGTTIKIKVQETMPVFKDPRVVGKAYKDTDRDWWFAGHTLTATPQLKAYKKRKDGRPLSLRTTLLSSVPRLAAQSVTNASASQTAQYLGYVVVNKWETNYTLRKGVVYTTDVLQVEQRYANVVSVGNVRQPDKPNLPGQILPSIAQEPLINTLKQYEFSRFWVK